MDEARYERYRAWRNEALRQCRAAAEPPVASRLPKVVDVAAIRARLGQAFSGRACTQQEFADRFGFSLATVQDWEHGRRKPDHAARVLLLAIAHDPLAVDAAVRTAIVQADAERERAEPAEVEVVKPSSRPFEVKKLGRKRRGCVSARKAQLGHDRGAAPSL